MDMMCSDEEGNLRSSSLKMQLVPFTKSPPHQKLHFYALLTSLIPEPFSQFSLRVTRTWTHTHIISSPHTEKMLRKPSLDAVNLFFLDLFGVPFFLGWLYISYITIMFRYRDRIGTTQPRQQLPSVVSVQLQRVRDLLFSHGRVVGGRHQGRIDDGRADGGGKSNGKGCIDLKTKDPKGFKAPSPWKYYAKMVGSKWNFRVNQLDTPQNQKNMQYAAPETLVERDGYVHLGPPVKSRYLLSGDAINH